ncbi:MAG TPA: M56 family metallopeptidase [Rhizomicrobium sp.]|nr:M56 family metallopeptidase [Rhizomicrobium sp.]
MTDFLFMLAKINLAMAAGIVAVALLRRPMRAAFHATVAYALWLLVPAAMLASLLPPRIAAVTAPLSGAAHSSGTQIPAALGSARMAVQALPFDWSVRLFAVWIAGMGATLLYLAWAQHKFHKAESLGVAGPAVVGFFKPRIVVPSGFAAQFNAPEQEAILAHEKMHLARQDARLNAIVALLRCLNWFNPLVHLGALWFRRDQELACDTAALGHVSRVDYANALLKSQMRAVTLPLGCAWPGSEHPLTERVALLRRQMPTRGRRWTGATVILSLTVLAGLGAWAAQPAQVAPASSKHHFVGGIVYSQRNGNGGPASFLTLEAGKEEKSLGLWSRHVTMHFPYGMALADSAIYDFDPRSDAGGKTITLIGHVKLLTSTLDMDGLPGQKLVFDARTGLLNLDGKVMPSGMPKFVLCKKDCKFTDR